MNDLNAQLRKTATRQEWEDDTAEGLGGQHGCCLCHPAASAVDGTEMSNSVRTRKIHLSYLLPQEKTKARTDHSREPEHNFWILITCDVFEAKLHEVVQSLNPVLTSLLSSHAL